MKIHRPMTPLRQRMLEDMQIRNYSPHTIDGYLRYAAQFAKHFGTSPDRLGPEHIRTYQPMVLVSDKPTIFIELHKLSVSIFELAVVLRLFHAGRRHIFPLRGEPYDHRGVDHRVVL